MSKSDFIQKSSFSSYSKIVDYLQEFTVVPKEVIQNGVFVRFFANIFNYSYDHDFFTDAKSEVERIPEKLMHPNGAEKITSYLEN